MIKLFRLSKHNFPIKLKINVDDREELYVVDIITFNAQRQIESIRAYLGRGDG